MSVDCVGPVGQVFRLCYSLMIYRAALGEGAAHPWQLTVQNDSTEAKIELVPATREGTDSCEKSPSQQTIGVLNPLASVMAGMHNDSPGDFIFCTISYR